MGYRIKEMVYTLQGEGANTGEAVVLCRFEGCNLRCSFCDTNYSGIDGTGGGEFSSADDLVDALRSCWGGEGISPRVLLTGGEPLLQVDRGLVEALRARNFLIMLETNGTLLPPAGIDWICVSPKGGADPVLRKGNELKLVHPQIGVDPEKYLALDFQRFYLQPIWGDETAANTRLVLEYCMKHPHWRFGSRIHLTLGIP